MGAPDRDLDAVRDIGRAAREIATFVAGMDLDGFLVDSRTQMAVLHRLIILGEATKRLSPDFRARYPELPWKDIAGMRDVLVHAYHRVVLSRVWDIATVQTPELPIALGPLVDAGDEDRPGVE
jgi:uncharacterized protein with HEPN domain